MNPSSQHVPINDTKKAMQIIILWRKDDLAPGDLVPSRASQLHCFQQILKGPLRQV